ncbi:hypothetical protein ACFFU1_03475 [Algibacter miyuki]|uniref:STAS/SEC14 domain-containing protein n=1 Tax=Algibacter miyuki TaxID=1306933 RepID=A0ABV5GWK8_9FLAO|nr:hypothetical protein [Algibacter miyuki]MDN3665277.1 hypothetical protein [Algibacter miyuki]
MIHSVYNHQTQILETEFKDVVSTKDLVRYLLHFKSNKLYPRQLRSIVDATDVVVTFTFKDLQLCNQAKTKSLEDYAFVASAVVISNPATAAISTLYGAIAQNKKYKYKVFSTRSAALSWLDGFSFK